jgi:hypothetical protein
MKEEAIYQADEDLTYEVSDEALETAATNKAQFAWTMICTGKRCLHSMPSTIISVAMP